MPEIVAYPRSKVMALCRELGHDPSKVSLIVIEPAWIKVEYMHPLHDDHVANVSYPLVDEVSDDQPA